jgi:hypothetical protein
MGTLFIPSSQPVCLPRPSVRAHRLAVRTALAVMAVLICYRFEWQWLRYLTSEFNLRLDLLFGIVLQRVSADTVFWKGIYYQYQNACTFADVWCGAVPLLWNLRQSWRRNLVFLIWFSAALFTFNILRLTASDVLFNWGIPWSLAHEAFSGLAYFAVWIFIWERKAWQS